MEKQNIIVKGAKEHNLKNVDIILPRNKLIVFTGLSGSGKSSLAFDTIYAEGQRRYVESLSSYARQFLGQMEKPNVEYIEGLSPAISIDQKTTSKNPRSTVGTVTEIYDYYRLLFARIGKPHCPKCGKPIESQSIDQMVDTIMKFEDRTKIQILAPITRGKKGQHKKIIDEIKREGYVRVRIDGVVMDISEIPELEKTKVHNIEVVIDRIVVKEGIHGRITDSLETALKLGDGLVIIDKMGQEEILMSQKFACIKCNIAIDEISTRMFSFNSPFGMCQDCNGLGIHKKVDKELVLPNMDLTIRDGAIEPFSSANKGTYYFQMFETLAREHGFSVDAPLKEASKEFIDELLYGTKGRELEFVFESHYNGSRTFKAPFEGVIENLQRRYKETESDYMRNKIEDYMSNNTCDSCKGKRLRKESLSVFIESLNIIELTEKSINKSLEFFEKLKLNEREEIIADQILKEINARLGFLRDVGLEYLSLDRASGTLSGGESQRIRLATQIGSALVGVLYVLDEPSIGLHQRDNERLLKTLRHLTDLGNTLIVVEHDEDTMKQADQIVDIGPYAGIHGGEIVAQGTIEDIMNTSKSITGQYLSGNKTIQTPQQRKLMSDSKIVIKGATENNLKNIDVEFPLGLWTCVTGVSGSGKSSLVNEVLYKGIVKKLRKTKERPGKHKSIEGIEQIDKVIDIDQSPIGRTPRSNPATYTGVFDHIRDLFAMTPEAKSRGYKKGRFSFNVKGGRCESCRGDGIIKIEMHFLPDVYVPCEVCGGHRYNRETLQVKYKGKSIAQVLEMNIEDSLEFFDKIPKIKNKMQTLYDVGLGYIKLGQPSTQLSGGEAQRIKLATELSKRSTGKTIYILDEPTTGLHMDDIAKLIKILERLVESGNTVIVIEHNLDVIKQADHIIDLGPEGGLGGGFVIAKGTPEKVANNKKSYTGKYLKKIGI